MDEKKSYLSSKASKYALGTHRGPLPGDGGEEPMLEHVETADTITLEKLERTPTQNLRRHWARFWCCYSFFSIIFLAIFLPIFFLIIIPAVAQRVVDNSTLLLAGADVMQPRPDSIQLSIQSVLKLPIGLPVRIDPITLDLFNRDGSENGTWTKLYMDGKVIKANENATLDVDKQPSPLNVPNWKNYVHGVVFKEHGPLSVYGKTTAYIGSLKAKVTMDKDIPQNTLNSFAGFSIKDTQLLLPPKEDGTNLVANATLPNPSVLTLEIGTTTLDLKSGDLVIGNATLDNLILRPGNHSTPVHGMLDLTVLLTNLPKILGQQASSLKNGYLSLDTVGKSVFWEGVEVPYYTEVMKNLTMTAQVPLGGLVTNTLRGVLHHNGTNVFSEAADKLPSMDSLLDDLHDNPSLKGSLSKRDVDDFMSDPEKRSAMLEALDILKEYL